MSPKPWPWQQQPAQFVDVTERSRAGKRRRAIGRRVEEVVAHRLRELGLFMVEKINVEQRRVGKTFLFTKKVAGDFRAVLPPKGTAVLVEVKHRDNDTLTASDLAPHQREALDSYLQLGGLPLLVWARGTDIAVMRWSGALSTLFKTRGNSLRWEVPAGQPGIGAVDLAVRRPFVEAEWVLDATHRAIPSPPPKR